MPTRHGNQQGTMSAAHRTAATRKTEKLHRLFEDEITVRFAAKTARGYARSARVFTSWLRARGIAFVDVRSADIQAY